MTTQAPLDHVLHNGETLEFYWAVAGQENKGFNDYLFLKQEWLSFSSEDPLKASQLFDKVDAYWCKYMNVLIDEIVHLTQEGE